MKIRKNDKVKIMRGRDAGKTGLVLRTFPAKNTALVEGINQFKKHKRGEAKGQGEIVVITKPIDVSKLMLVDSEGNTTRVGFIVENGKKYRVSKKTGNKIVAQIVKEEENNEKVESKTKSGKGSDKKKESEAKSEKKSSKGTKSEK